MILFCTPLFSNQVSISIACPTLYNYQVGLNMSKKIHVGLILVILLWFTGLLLKFYCLLATIVWLLLLALG